MVAIRTLAEGDAERPLVGEPTTIINRMKATLPRLGSAISIPSSRRL
jgi:hypothetical protein